MTLRTNNAITATGPLPPLTYSSPSARAAAPLFLRHGVTPRCLHAALSPSLLPNGSNGRVAAFSDGFYATHPGERPESLRYVVPAPSARWDEQSPHRDRIALGLQKRKRIYAYASHLAEVVQEEERQRADEKEQQRAARRKRKEAAQAAAIIQLHHRRHRSRKALEWAAFEGPYRHLAATELARRREAAAVIASSYRTWATSGRAEVHRQQRRREEAAVRVYVRRHRRANPFAAPLACTHACTHVRACAHARAHTSTHIHIARSYMYVHTPTRALSCVRVVCGCVAGKRGHAPCW